MEHMEHEETTHVIKHSALEHFCEAHSTGIDIFLAALTVLELGMAGKGAYDGYMETVNDRKEVAQLRATGEKYMAALDKQLEETNAKIAADMAQTGKPATAAVAPDSNIISAPKIDTLAIRIQNEKLKAANTAAAKKAQINKGAIKANNTKVAQPRTR